MHKFVLLIFSLFAVAATSSVFALPVPFHVKPGEISRPLRGVGSANGGVAQDELSLLGVETSSVESGEKISVNYGDPTGKVLQGAPGFFQVALDRDGRRITIDLSQITRTGMDPMQLKKIMAKSKFVVSSDMTMDPHDQSTNLTFQLNAPVELRVSTDHGTRSRVVLELKVINK